jgi:4-hydroxy-tetrahydrodipicolinate synthase
MRRGVLASDAQRKPAAVLSAQARDEIEFLLSTIARMDKRADLGKRAALSNTEVPVSGFREAKK